MPLSSDPSWAVLPACLWVFGILSFVWSPWALSLPTQRQTERARPWLPSLVDSILHYSVSAEKVSTITCILEGHLPHRLGVPFPGLQGLCARAALPTWPAALQES